MQGIHSVVLAALSLSRFRSVFADIALSPPLLRIYTGLSVNTVGICERLLSCLCGVTEKRIITGVHLCFVIWKYLLDMCSII